MNESLGDYNHTSAACTRLLQGQFSVAVALEISFEIRCSKFLYTGRKHSDATRTCTCVVHKIQVKSTFILKLICNTYACILFVN
jgi:hypothetical protein